MFATLSYKINSESIIEVTEIRGEYTGVKIVTDKRIYEIKKPRNIDSRADEFIIPEIKGVLTHLQYDVWPVYIEDCNFSEILLICSDITYVIKLIEKSLLTSRLNCYITLNYLLKT